MPDPLVYPVIVLFVVLVGAIIAFVADGRNTRLRHRVEALGPPEQEPVEEERSIRVVRPGGQGWRRFAARALRMPADLPAAHTISPRIVVVLGLLCGLVVGLTAARLLADWLATMLGVLAGFGAMRAIFGAQFGGYQRRLREQLPDTIEMVVSAIRAGLPVSDAFRGVASEMAEPTKGEFTRLVNEMALGTSADAGLLHLHERTGVTEYAIFAVTISVQNRTGGKLVESVQKLAEMVRHRLAMVQRAQALASEARVSAVILGSLPFVAGAGLSLIRPGYLDPLFSDPRGQRLMVIAVVGLFLGIVTMRKLIRGATAE